MMCSRAQEPEMSTATRGSTAGTRESAVTLTERSAARSARVIWGAVPIRRYSSGICAHLELLARLPGLAARFLVPGVSLQHATVGLERARLVAHLDEQLAEAQQHLAVPGGVGLQERDRLARLSLAGQQLGELQAEARHLRRFLQRLAVGLDRGRGLPALQGGAGRRHPPLGHLQPQLGNATLDRGLAGIDGQRAPERRERAFRIVPPQRREAGSDERGRVVLSGHERRGEALLRLRHPARLERARTPGRSRPRAGPDARRGPRGSPSPPAPARPP